MLSCPKCQQELDIGEEMKPNFEDGSVVVSVNCRTCRREGEITRRFAPIIQSDINAIDVWKTTRELAMELEIHQ